jgi:glucoamylase
MKTSIVGAVLSVVLFGSTLLPEAGRGQINSFERGAPGAPGKDAQWLSAGKVGVGTANTLESKVWFTLHDGVMTEVYYPDVTVANVQKLELLIAQAPSGEIQTESEDTTSKLIPANDSLSFTQVNTARSGEYRIEKRYTIDPQRDVVLIKIRFEGDLKNRKNDYRLYVYFDQSLNNSGMHDTAFTQANAFVASDGDKASALVASMKGTALDKGGFVATTNGFLGTSDGLTQIKSAPRTFPPKFKEYTRAENGNVVQVGELPAPESTSEYTLALGFGKTRDEALRASRESLAKGFDACDLEYVNGWKDYVKTLRAVAPKYQSQFNMAAMILKAHEDKIHRGANIASLSVPWGGGANANEPNVGGYHLVWSRDLYQVATAFMALGDKQAAIRALTFLFNVQQKPDGSFPQNSWLDGRPFWNSLQMDEVAYPLILAYQLGRTDNDTWLKHVRPAADFLVKHGPYTPQERWEEESGYSPSTVAAEIAGLVAAAEIARRNSDEVSANVYLAAADEWVRNIEAWTVTTTGKRGDGVYYLRITENNDPNDGEPREINNGGGTFDEREIVDAGFLELVRLGIKSPKDRLIARSISVVDRTIKVETAHGPGFYRYNHDGYGEMDDGRPWNWDGKYTGKGRLWALLAGERGQYELARGEKEAALKRLDAMQGFANEGLMIPEQVWDSRDAVGFRAGEGTGSATPLAWSMAQFIRLATNLQESQNIDTPDIVAARYVRKAPPSTSDGVVNFPADEVLQALQAGSSFRVTGRARGNMRVFAMHGERRFEVPLKYEDKGRFAFDVTVPQGRSTVLVGTVGKSGATSFHRAQLNGLSADEKRALSNASLSPQFVERIKASSTSPIIDGDRVTFVYRGEAKHVEVVGDHTEWAPRGHVFREIPGTQIRYYTLRFPPDARVEYKFIADGEWILDSLNPNKFDNGVGGQNSNFTMPKYKGERDELWPRLLRGTLEGLGDPSDPKRKIQVYLPPGYAQSARRYPVVYLQDGSQYIQLGLAAAIADRLIMEKKLEPFIVVFIDPIERMRERDYWASDGFADYMAKQLVPLVDAKYRTRAHRDSRALLGASLGGVISVWTALRHPDIFARVGGQSTAFQIDEERELAALARLDDESRRTHPMRFYFDVGRMESILGVNRRVRVMLAAKGYPVTYRESEAGHNYTTWRDQLENAYTALLSR